MYDELDSDIDDDDSLEPRPIVWQQNGGSSHKAFECNGGAPANPTDQLAAAYYNNNNNARMPLLTDYQDAALQRIFEVDFAHQRGLYYVMPAGFGKSYLMAAIGALYMRIGYGVVCISVARLDKTLARTFAQFYGFDEGQLCVLHHRSDGWRLKLNLWLKKRQNPGKTVFLLDEAHLFNQAHDLDKQVGRFVKMTPSLLDYIKITTQAHIYMFSATPVTRSLLELNIINLLVTANYYTLADALPFPLGEIEFEERFGPLTAPNLVNIVAAIKPFMIYVYKADILPRLGPVDCVEIEFEPSDLTEYLRGYTYYRDVHPGTYFQAQTVNEIGTHKIAKLVNLLQLYPTEPAIVYVERIDKLSDIIAAPLVAANITFAILSAQTSLNVWHEVLARFNSDANQTAAQLQVIFYGPGAQIGISFETARRVYFMTPPHTYFDFIQIASRALRKNSLLYLSGAERAVHVVIFVSVFNPSTTPIMPVGNGRLIMTIDQSALTHLMQGSQYLYEMFNLILERLNLYSVGGAREDAETTELDVLELITYM